MSEKSFQLHLTSQDGIILNGGSISDLWYDLPYKDINNNSNVYLSLIHAVIPNSWYNINETNNVLKIFLHTIYFTITIPIGNYTIISLANEINTLIHNINDTFNIYNFKCTYDLKMSKIIFINSFNVFIDTQNSSICSVIGNEFENNDVPYLFSIISTKPVDLIPHKCVCVAIPNLQSGNVHVGISVHYRSMISSIPVDVGPFGLVIFKNHNSYKMNIGNTIPNQINVKLIDQLGQIINLNGLHYSICFQIDIE
jgi:hypothetical protein